MWLGLVLLFVVTKKWTLCALISPPYHSLTKAEREGKPPHKAVRERERERGRKRRAIETVYMHFTVGVCVGT